MNNTSQDKDLVDIYSDMLGQACQLPEEDGYTMNNLLYIPLPVYIQKSRHVTETELTLTF